MLRISAPFIRSTFDGRLFPLFLQTFIVNKWLQIYENHIYIYIYIYICELRLKRGMWIVS